MRSPSSASCLTRWSGSWIEGKPAALQKQKRTHSAGCASIGLVKKVFLTSPQTKTHFVGLSFEKATARGSARLRAERYFCRRTRRRQKCFELYLRLRAQTLRGFFDSLKGRTAPAVRPFFIDFVYYFFKSRLMKPSSMSMSSSSSCRIPASAFRISSGCDSSPLKNCCGVMPK